MTRLDLIQLDQWIEAMTVRVTSLLDIYSYYDSEGLK